MELLGFSAVVFHEGSSYSAWCPDLDVASQGDTMEEAIANLKEALELHIDCLSSVELQEIKKRQGTRLVTTVQVPVSSC
ncbi:type II toxin-antitoxin system HicB family antitoxin [Candidatus Micrarchaeota archaeon]|nr:type II toxin-antitoxin system HicB family antitoxin [Candidatus Micrarchaeota archaeon]